MDKPLHTALVCALVAHKRLARAEFQQLGLSAGQPKVLACLLAEEGLVQRELAQRCNVEPATMTTLLRGLMTGGLVYRESVRLAGGKRANCIFLTPEGRARAMKVNGALQALEDHGLEGFAAEERRTLLALLERVTLNLGG